jgi:SAM-dependent methyltransferase
MTRKSLIAFAIMLRKVVLLACALALPAQAQQPAWSWDDGTVPFVVTPMEIVERMLRMAEVGPGDTLIDLGSGDGRIVIEAAKRGARGLGVDLDPSLVKIATENARKAGVADRARFEARDIFETDLSGASVIAFYLLPDFNAKLLPRLLKLKPGTRIVSHDGGIGAWPADEKLEMRAPEKSVGLGGLSRVELWIVPADAAGRWTSVLGATAGAGDSRSRSNSRCSTSTRARRAATCWCVPAACAATKSSWSSPAWSPAMHGTTCSSAG